MKPLANQLRPSCLEEVVGQDHLIGEGKILTRLFQEKQCPNLIFYGPPGTGKTTVAFLLARELGCEFVSLNATEIGTAEIKAVLKRIESEEISVLLYLDEIQHLNKKQQQLLLKYMEIGGLTLIASTTENPYFCIFSAILSRATILEFRLLSEQACKKGLEQAMNRWQDSDACKIQVEEDALIYLAQRANGDLRRALSALELAYLLSRKECLTLEHAIEATQTAHLRHDKDGDSHYDVLSAFQKSIRGSDVNASLHYLARLIEGGDLISIGRRLCVIASEDIGLANADAIQLTKTCVDVAFQLGFPEARIPLAQAVIYLAQCPKSNSAYLAIDKAIADVRSGKGGEIPSYLRDGHYEGAQKLNHATGYLYPHDYPHHFVPQRYLPETIQKANYYQPANNQVEQQMAQFQRGVRHQTNSTRLR